MLNSEKSYQGVLNNTPLKELPLRSIKPSGWLKNQLLIQANGLTGKLEEHWEDVGHNSGWLGGYGESWERGPYYLDGLLPLAYLLEDEKLINKASKWIEWTFSSQKENGNFGPDDTEDWWCRMIMCKVLIQYEEATHDERVIPFLTKYFQYQKDHIISTPLEGWGEARGGENVLCILWLYGKTNDVWLLDLANIIMKQTIDWTTIYTRFPFWRYQEQFDHRTHVVNVAMALKYPAIFYQLTGNLVDREASDKGINSLITHHGQIHGMFSGDEWLAGTHPSQGVELCAVVEYMFTLENLVRILGDGKYGDILERVAFNALPATISADWHSHQYDQQVNQVLCSVDTRNWTQNKDDSNTFGLEPNFGCCTANMHQGWPKFTARLWMGTNDHGIAAISYAPCIVDTIVGDHVELNIKVETDYPFNESIKIKLELTSPSAFPMKLRIPNWCKYPTVLVNGKIVSETIENGFMTIHQEWCSGDTVQLQLPMEVSIEHRAQYAVGILRGPLCYVLSIKESWKKRSGNKPFYNWDVHPESPWNYGLLVELDNPSLSFKLVESTVKSQPFEGGNAPIKLIGKGRRIPSWGLKNNSADTPPIGPVKTDEPDEEIVLVPYGSARLRIGEFPLISKE